MSKVNIKRLDSLSHNDSTATKSINDNFAALQKAVEDCLSRTGKTPNFMDAELDMNSRRIINTGDPVDDTDAVNYGKYKEHIATAVQAATEAKNSAKSANSSKEEARQYANQAKQAAETAIQTVTSGKTDLENIINEGIVEISDAIDAGKEDLNQSVDDGLQAIEDGKADIADIIEDGKDELNQIVTDGKADLDETAGNYYTKAEVDEKIAEGGSSGIDVVEFSMPTSNFDPSNMYETWPFAGWYIWQSEETYKDISISFDDDDARLKDLATFAEFNDYGNGYKAIIVYAKVMPSTNITGSIICYK